MWIITTIGFFSIVQKPEDVRQDLLTIRSRSRADLDSLRSLYLPELGATIETHDSDYRYRAQAPRKAAADAMARITGDIDYSNFKNAVAERQGNSRAKLYGRVWDILYRIQTDNI